MSAVGKQIKELTDAVSGTLQSTGEENVVSCQEACSLILHWLQHLETSELTQCCDEMLFALKDCAVETAGYVSMGLVRPAIFSLRCEIDLVFAWLFYKDHPVEWNQVRETGEGFYLKKDSFDFLSNNKAKFGTRMKLLEKHKQRSQSDPYRLLSAHVHGQSDYVLPRFKKLSDLVYSQERQVEAIKLQAEVSEYISDIFLSYFGDKWASLPASALTNAQKRVPNEKHPELFS